MNLKVTKKSVLSIDEVTRDGIECVFVASRKREVIDIIRERIAYIKNIGVRII